MTLKKCLFAFLLAFLPAGASAQQASWPTNPIRVIVPYPPGSSGDIILRRVAPLARIDLVMVANKNLKANNIQELVALAKAEPGKLTYASTGIGSSHQLYMELFKIRNGIDILHVPYKGTGQATPDLISGQVDMMFFGSAQAISGVEGGQIKALGAGSLQRLERLPQIATIAESGNPDFAANNLWGIWSPAGTPDVHIDKLRRVIAESLDDPEIRKFYRDSALTMLDGGGDEMMKVIREQRAKWPEVIKAANIKLTE